MIGRAPGPREAPLELRRYGFDRAYRRSYRLPSDTHTTTTDGETFYVIEETGYPSVLALRPRRDRAPVR